ncbi:MAG: Trk system potassium transporter TrkA [Chlamydiota bacterium]|nr:Trk system potassium transporter TrkA [Chlamydiota bacterium]
MNIVIVGAGELGRYIATLLSKEEHNIIIIDKDPKKIEAVSQNIDVAVRHGSGTDWQLLDDLHELSPDLLIAITDNDETNLVACSIAKNLGYPHTIARIHDNRYLNRTRLDFGRIFDVDYFIGPELLVANEILKYMMSPGSIHVENFAHGAVQLRTLVVPSKWRHNGKKIHELDLPHAIMIGLIERETDEKRGGIPTGKKQVIFPHGSDTLQAGDEVSFIGETNAISEIHQFFGSSSKSIKSVVILGGTPTAINLAKLLEPRNISVTIIDKNYDTCCLLAEHLPDCVIINHDGTDIEFLRSEKVGTNDIFVACTNHDEVNLMGAVLGKEVGCQNAVVVLSNNSFAPFAAQLGINHTVSPKISASNHILSQILSGTVRSLVSIYDNQAEIMEVNVSTGSSIVGIPLCELGPLLPSDFLIAMIQNRGRIMIANGNRIISSGDTVIVITSPKHVKELEKIF